MSPSALAHALELLAGKVRFAKTEDDRRGALIEQSQAELAMKWLRNKRQAKQRGAA